MYLWREKNYKTNVLLQRTTWYFFSFAFLWHMQMSLARVLGESCQGRNIGSEVVNKYCVGRLTKTSCFPPYTDWNLCSYPRRLLTICKQETPLLIEQRGQNWNMGGREQLKKGTWVVRKGKKEHNVYQMGRRHS